MIFESTKLGINVSYNLTAEVVSDEYKHSIDLYDLQVNKYEKEVMIKYKGRYYIYEIGKIINFECHCVIEYQDFIGFISGNYHIKRKPFLIYSNDENLKSIKDIPHFFNDNKPQFLEISLKFCGIGVS